MDILENIQRQEKNRTNRSDWCKALSYYSNEQKICHNCFALKSQLSNFVLPLDKAFSKLKDLNIAHFATAMQAVGKPLIFSNKHLKSPSSFLVYYTHGIDFADLPSTLDIRDKVFKPAAIILSPDYYSKSKRTNEASVVKEIQQYFNPTAFIKLPIYDMEELIGYAASEKCEMTILPISKLAEYLRIVQENPDRPMIPAAFYPVQKQQSHLKV
ncbi:MAG: hypothetical protein ACJAT1_001305 [Marivirga sp.]|jgi:hypothetical protein